MRKRKRNPFRALRTLLLILGAIYIFLNILPVHHVEAHPFFENGDKPLVVAHQGGEHLRPSNTMIAFEHAKELGVDVIETDIHISKDGYLDFTHHHFHFHSFFSLLAFLNSNLITNLN